MNNKYTCDCCGNKIPIETEIDIGLICPICFWEMDIYSNNVTDAFCFSCANQMNLYQAQYNYLKEGIIQPKYLAHKKIDSYRERSHMAFD